MEVIQVYNTLFPDSCWDDSRKAGYQGTQTVNIAVLCDLDGDIAQLDDEAKASFAVESHMWITADEGCEAGKFDKYVRSILVTARTKGLLQ